MADPFADPFVTPLWENYSPGTVLAAEWTVGDATSRATSEVAPLYDSDDWSVGIGGPSRVTINSVSTYSAIVTPPSGVSEILGQFSWTATGKITILGNDDEVEVSVESDPTTSASYGAEELELIFTPTDPIFPERTVLKGITISDPEFVSLAFESEGPVQWQFFLLSAGPESGPDAGGIKWSARADVPGNGENIGSLRFVQNVKTMRLCRFADGSSIVFSTGDEWHLDSVNPYCSDMIWPDTGSPEGYLRWKAWADDTPKQPIDAPSSFYIDEVIVNDFFRLFFLYVFPDGSTMPLGVAPWQWQGRVSRDGGAVMLELDNEYSTVPSAPDGGESTELPVLSPIAFGQNNELEAVIDRAGHGDSAYAVIYYDGFMVPPVN